MTDIPGLPTDEDIAAIHRNNPLLDVADEMAARVIAEQRLAPVPTASGNAELDAQPVSPPNQPEPQQSIMDGRPVTLHADGSVEFDLVGGRRFVATKEWLRQQAEERGEWDRRDHERRERVGPKPDVWDAELPSAAKAADLLKSRGGVLHLCSTCKHSVQFLEVVQSESGNTHHQHRSFCSLLTEDSGDSLEHEGPVHFCGHYRPSVGTIAMRVAANAYVTVASMLKRSKSRPGPIRRAIDALRTPPDTERDAINDLMSFDYSSGTYASTSRPDGPTLARLKAAMAELKRLNPLIEAPVPPRPLGWEGQEAQWRHVWEQMQRQQAMIDDVVRDVGGVLQGGPFSGLGGNHG